MGYLEVAQAIALKLDEVVDVDNVRIGRPLWRGPEEFALYMKNATPHSKTGSYLYGWFIYRNGGTIVKGPDARERVALGRRQFVHEFRIDGFIGFSGHSPSIDNEMQKIADNILYAFTDDLSIGGVLLYNQCNLDDISVVQIGDYLAYGFKFNVRAVELPI